MPFSFNPQQMMAPMMGQMSGWGQQGMMGGGMPSNSPMGGWGGQQGGMGGWGQQIAQNYGMGLYGQPQPQMGQGQQNPWQSMQRQPPRMSSDGYGDPAGGIDYQSRGGRMRNAARHVNALRAGY